MIFKWTQTFEKVGENLSLSTNVHFQKRQQVVKDFNLPKWKWEASGKTFEESQQVVKFGMALILTFLEMTKKSQPIEKNQQFLEF